MLLSAGAANEEHPLAELVASIGCLINDYDDEHFKRLAASPASSSPELRSRISTSI